eukprot:SAG31_NODE_10026_length_1194_cov_0.774429_1_plen_143_part_00
MQPRAVARPTRAARPAAVAKLVVHHPGAGTARSILEDTCGDDHHAGRMGSSPTFGSAREMRTLRRAPFPCHRCRMAAAYLMAAMVWRDLEVARAEVLCPDATAEQPGCDDAVLLFNSVTGAVFVGEPWTEVAPYAFRQHDDR